MSVFKILRAAERAALDAEGRFAGSADDRRDGFVHLSAAHQVEGTLRRHFAGEDGLWLLALAEERLGDALRWEASWGGEAFPHLFRPLEAADVVWAAPLPLRDGRHLLPALD